MLQIPPVSRLGEMMNKANTKFDTHGWLRLNEDMPDYEIDDVLMAALAKSVPEDGKYSEMVKAMRACALAEVDEWLDSRKQRMRDKAGANFRNNRMRIPRNAELYYSLGDIFTQRFPKENVSEIFERSFCPAKYMSSPSLGLAMAPMRVELTYIVKEYAKKKRDILKEYDLQVMQGRREAVSLEIEGKEYPLDLALLMILADYYDWKERDAPLAKAFLALNHPLLSAGMFWTNLYDIEEQDRAWQSGSLDVCRDLLYHSGDFVFSLTDEQAMDIMALNDADMLQTLAQGIHYLFEKDYGIGRRRISKNMLDKLMTFLACHKDKDVIRLLHYNSDGIPEKYRKMYSRD